MTVACAELGFKLELERGKGREILLENAWSVNFLVSDLYAQLRGEGGALVFYEGEKEVEFSKKGEVIFNPFSLNFNNKKIQTRLLAEAKELTVEYGSVYFGEIKKCAIEYMDKLLEHMPYHVVYNDEFEIHNLIKLLELQLNYQDEDFEEQQISYVKVMNQLCGMDLFVFINLSQYITEENYLKLRKNLNYLEVYILFIETAVQHHHDNPLIVDKDLCIIG